MRRILLSFLMLAGCSGDATGPDACDAPKACSVGGTDVAIVQVYAEAEDTWAGRIASADSFDVVVEVLNRGTRRTAAGRVEVDAWTATGSAQLPSLGVGERIHVRVPLAYSRTYLVHGHDPAAITPFARIVHEGDDRAVNDTLSGDEFITDLPVFDVAPVPWGLQSARPGGSVRMSAWISRRNALGSSTVAVDALYCVLDGDRGCTASSWGPLLRAQSMGTYGGFTYSGAVQLSPGQLPPTPGTYRLAVCIVPSEGAVNPRRDPDNPDHRCVESGVLQLLP